MDNQFAPGLIGVVGPNGSGKTTLIEHLTPYRSMVSRPGSLYDHFFNSVRCPSCDYIDVYDGKVKACPKCKSNKLDLLDGLRDLTYADGDVVYRFVINVDLRLKQSTAYVYRDGEALNDKLDQYDQVVERLFGPFDIFRKSVFSGQGEDSLSELTPGKLKDFFVRLLNLERYEKVYRPINKERLKTIEEEIASERGKMSELEGLIESEADVEHRLKDNQEELARVETTGFQPCEWGGQKVMVESVLRQAIKLINQGQGNGNIDIAFCDESDGAFDPENAQTYYNMLNYVHNEGDLHNTFIITHRKELIGQPDQGLVFIPFFCGGLSKWQPPKWHIPMESVGGGGRIKPPICNLNSSVIKTNRWIIWIV